MLYSTPATASLPTLLSVGSLIGLLVLPWAIRLPRLALSVLFASLVFGQLLRLPLPGQGGGLLLSDLAVVLVLLTALLSKLNEKTTPRSKIPSYQVLVTSPFILWSLFTLTLNAPELGVNNFTIAFAYWPRLTSHLLLIPAFLILFHRQTLRNFALKGLILTGFALALLGLLQIIFLPNMADILGALPGTQRGAGWDPHQGRLFATWLDPNFLGAFFAMILPFSMASLQKTNLKSQTISKDQNLNSKRRRFVAICVLYSLIFSALVLTQSRSALLALALSLTLLSPLLISAYLAKSSHPKLVSILAVSALLIIFLLGATTVLSDRLVGLVTFDPTVQLRYLALQEAWHLAQNNTTFGVGYNAYQFAAVDANLISDFTIHSRAGSDNSFLNLWTTTGLLGLLFFLLPWAVCSTLLVQRIFKYASPISSAALISLVTLFIHANFVNSLLYSHLLIAVVVITALGLSTDD